MDSPALFTAINSHFIRRGFRAGEISVLLKTVFLFMYIFGNLLITPLMSFQNFNYEIPNILSATRNSGMTADYLFLQIEVY